MVWTLIAGEGYFLSHGSRNTQKAACRCGHCDWERHTHPKGSWTLHCPLSSPEELLGRQVSLFMPAHGKLSLSFKKEGGNSITSPVSQPLNPECVSHHHHKQSISCPQGREQHRKGNGEFITPDQVTNTGGNMRGKQSEGLGRKSLMIYQPLSRLLLFRQKKKKKAQLLK